jgi:hypothetical protein
MRYKALGEHAEECGLNGPDEASAENRWHPVVVKREDAKTGRFVPKRHSAPKAPT